MPFLSTSWIFKRRVGKLWNPLFLSLLLSISISLFKLPKDGPPLVDRLTNYKSTKRLNHHSEAPFKYFWLPFWKLLFLLPVLCCLTSWNCSIKELLAWKISEPVLFFPFVSHISSALWQCMTPGSRPYPFMYRQSRTGLPLTTDLKSFCYLCINVGGSARLILDLWQWAMSSYSCM